MGADRLELFNLEPNNILSYVNKVDCATVVVRTVSLDLDVNDSEDDMAIGNVYIQIVTNDFDLVVDQDAKDFVGSKHVVISLDNFSNRY